MNIVYWGATLPEILGEVASAVSKMSEKPKISVQLDPSLKTFDFAASNFQEIVHYPASKVECLEELCERISEPPLLILDLWSLIFHPAFEKILQRLVFSFKKGMQTIVLCPRAWVGLWKSHPIFKKSDSQQQAFMEFAFGRALLIFEEFLNSPSNINLIDHSPTVGLMERICGRKSLSVNHLLGFSVMPKDCLKYPSRFIKHTFLANAVCNCILGKSFDGVIRATDFWWESSIEGAGNSTAGLQVLPEKRLQKIVFPQAWASYVNSQPVSASLAALLNSDRAEAIEVHLFAKWFYFLGVLEAESL